MKLRRREYKINEVVLYIVYLFEILFSVLRFTVLYFIGCFRSVSRAYDKIFNFEFGRKIFYDELRSQKLSTRINIVDAFEEII